MNSRYFYSQIGRPNFGVVASLMITLFVLGACTGQGDGENNGEEENITTNSIPLVLSDEYSIMKGGKRTFNINKDDSLILDISGYEFILPDPAFTYIRENINYPKMLGGPWAYINIIYNDSLEIRGELIEMSKENLFHIDKVMHELNTKNIKDFTIAFRFYIDNGKGQQEIDHFPVHIVN